MKTEIGLRDKFSFPCLDNQDNGDSLAAAPPVALDRRGAGPDCHSVVAHPSTPSVRPVEAEMHPPDPQAVWASYGQKAVDAGRLYTKLATFDDYEREKGCGR